MIPVKDEGGARAILPIVERLEEEMKTVSVIWLVQRGFAAANFLLGQGIKFLEVSIDEVDLAKDLVKKVGEVGLILMTGSGQQPTIEEKVCGAYKVPIVCYTDTWLGAYCQPFNRTLPSVYLVLDKFTANHILSLRPDLGHLNIFQVGATRFEEYPQERVKWLRQEIRAKLGLSPEKKLIVYFQPSYELSVETAPIVVAALNLLQKEEIYLAHLIHPKEHKFNDSRDRISYYNLLSSIAGPNWISDERVRAIKFDPTEIAVASDVLITALSTEAMLAVLRGGPPKVIYLNTRLVRKSLKENCAFEGKLPPVEKSLAFEIEHPDEAVEVIKKAFEKKAPEFQKLGEYKNGAERAAKVIKNLLTK